MTVDPGLVLKVIDGLEGVDGRNASVSEAEEEIPEVQRWQDDKMTRWQEVGKIFNLCDFCQDESKILS